MRPVEAEAPTSRIRRKRPLVLLAAAAALVVAAGTSLLFAFSHGRPATIQRGTSGSAAAAAPTSPGQSTGESAPTGVASASPDAPATKPFNPIAARAALDALAPTLIDCQIAGGRSGHIRVAFAPDGSVSSAKTLAPYADSPRGECVAAHLSRARVPPFVGEAPAYVYGFVIPR